MKSVLIFDFDGVLADTQEFMLATAGEICTRLGYRCQPRKADQEALETMSFDALARRLGLAEDLVAEFTRLSLRAFNGRTEPMPIFAGWEQVIPTLAAVSRLALVTGNGAGVVHRFLDHYGLAPYFDLILTLEDPGNRVEKIQRIILNLDGAGSRTFMIGDAVSDIHAARQAGICSIAVAWGHQSLAKLQQAAPDRIIYSPQELLPCINPP